MSETSGTVARLRLERDRFIAFAFAGADVLLELDTGHRVGYAAGATRTLFGAAADDLLGDCLFDRLAAEECDRLRAALTALAAGNRLAPLAAVAQVFGRCLPG